MIDVKELEEGFEPVFDKEAIEKIRQLIEENKEEDVAH
jgi:hypothetical protein